jgi:hypothetical protein
MEADLFYRTAQQMAPQPDPKFAEFTAGWRSISGSEKRKKVDSVASLNKMAERDLAELMSGSSLANNLFCYSPQAENYRDSLNSSEYDPGPSDIWNRDTIEGLERPIPAPANPSYTNLSNFPLHLPQGPPVSAILQQSRSGFGLPEAPVTSQKNYNPATPTHSRSSPMGMPVMPPAISVHYIPSDMIAIPNLIMRAPTNTQTPPFPSSLRSPIPYESPRFRERAPPPTRERIRERTQAVTSEDHHESNAHVPNRQPTHPEQTTVPSRNAPVSTSPAPTTTIPIAPPSTAAEKRPDENGGLQEIHLKSLLHVIS